MKMKMEKEREKEKEERNRIIRTAKGNTQDEEDGTWPRWNIGGLRGAG
jgi:hypothetical protein